MITELYIDYNSEEFKYRVDENNIPLSQDMDMIQEIIFHEKETLIRNCLFVVHINPKSSYIYQLRLWIELLKNTYYIEEGDLIENLQTLLNIYINIKRGNI